MYEAAYELRREKRSDRQASGREATHKKKGGGAEREVEKIGSAGRLYERLIDAKFVRSDRNGRPRSSVICREEKSNNSVKCTTGL
jgi:hypothetical protein